MLCIFLVYFNTKLRISIFSFKLRTNLFNRTANVNILVLNRNTNRSFYLILVSKLVIKQSEE